MKCLQLIFNLFYLMSISAMENRVAIFFTPIYILVYVTSTNLFGQIVCFLERLTYKRVGK